MTPKTTLREVHLEKRKKILTATVNLVGKRIFSVEIYYKVFRGDVMKRWQ